jgi:hypothetical protein
MKKVVFISLLITTSTSILSMQIERHRREPHRPDVNTNNLIDRLSYLSPAEKEHLTNPNIPLATRTVAFEEIRRQNAHPTQRDDN